MTKGMRPETELQALVRTRLGLRIEPHMADYLSKKLANPAGPVSLIGGDARTGKPRREIIDPRMLRQDPQSLPASI
jgi:hypothetical protein